MVNRNKLFTGLITGVAVANSQTLATREIAVKSWVVMREADRQELVAYAATGEALDKAGGYALQGEGRRFIERVEGSESNVIGLPVEEALALVQEAFAAAASDLSTPRTARVRP